MDELSPSQLFEKNKDNFENLFPKDSKHLEQISHYQIMQELGTGGMGKVYKAYDTKLQRTVALKVLLAQDQANEKQIARFLIEAKATARLVHPNIVRLYETGEHNKVPFFTMEAMIKAKKEPVKKTGIWTKKAGGLS